MTKAKSDYLFVYSSLLHGFSTAEYDYVAKFFDFIGPAKTRGKLSILNDIVVGTPSADDVFLKGELYKIRIRDQFSFAIGQLDEYEGVHPEPPKEPLYRRELTIAVPENGSEIAAWVYWYNGNVDGLPMLRSGDVTEFQGKKE